MWFLIKSSLFLKRTEHSLIHKSFLPIFIICSYFPFSTLHYTLVSLSWLLILPQFQVFALTVYRMIFLLSFPLEFLHLPCSSHPNLGLNPIYPPKCPPSFYKEPLPYQNFHDALYLLWQWLLCILHHSELCKYLSSPKSVDRIYLCNLCMTHLYFP